MGNPNILIVEDEKTASGLQVKLKALGYAAPICLTYDDAVMDAISEHRPDIVLMDIPPAGQFAGIETAVQIQQTYDIPVIRLIPQAQESILEQVKATPLVGYLLHPCRDQDLRSAIEMSLYLRTQKHLLRETEKALHEREEQHKQAEKELEKSRRYLEARSAMEAVTSATSAFLEPQLLLSKILEEVMTIPGIQANAGWAFMLEEGRAESIRLGAVQGVSAGLLDLDHTVPLDDCPACAAWLKDTGLTKLTPPDARLHLDLQSMAKVGVQSHIAIPLSVGQRILGVIILGWTESQVSPQMDRLPLLSIGRQVGLALRNAQLYQSALKMSRLDAINEISAAASSSLELDVVLQQVLETACQALNAEAGTILLTRPETSDLAFAYVSPGSLHIQTDQHIPAEQGIIGWVVQYHQVARINDIRRDPRTYRGLEPIFGPGVDSLICAPLIHRDQFTGVIAIFNKHYGEFDQEDANLLESVSSICASALDNARLYEDLRQSLLEKERTQAQLIQSEKIAALGRLAVSVAHEINNPLQAVQGCLSLLADELSGLQRPDKVNSYLQIVDKEIGRITNIVHSMRDFARPAPQGTRSTDVVSVLKDVLELADKQLQQSKVNVECFWGVDVPTIQANPNLLKQVFLNMILNAIDAMPAGGVLRISVILDQNKTNDDTLPQPTIRIEFSDTGPGMTPQALSRLFEPFYTTKEQGSGLGLYISYNIIQSLNGKIVVNSTIGFGTTFAISLPLNDAKG